MKPISEIRLQLEVLRDYLRYVEKNVEAGNCHWRTTKARIEILQWVLDEE